MNINIKNQFTVEQVYDILTQLQGNPLFTSSGIICDTICHNLPGEGHQKLYYYTNTKLFKCFTECDDTFDIFELVKKALTIQNHKTTSLYEAYTYVLFSLNIEDNSSYNNSNSLADWSIIERYERILNINLQTQIPQLKEYNKDILKYFRYDIKLTPWLNEHISQSVLNSNLIGYYPGEDAITIPHFDINNKFIGLRGRFLSDFNILKYGKYRPLTINNLLYTHPLTLNLYNLNRSKENIKFVKKAIVFEGEKSNLLYQSYFGFENDITVACCGNNFTYSQLNLLLQLGAQEIIIAFDKQFKEIGDKDFIKWTNKLNNIKQKYSSYAIISFLFDKNNLLKHKDSPIDQGKEVFLHLFQNRIIL